MCFAPDSEFCWRHENMTDHHKYASLTHTHTHSQFIFHHCGRPQRIEEMLICPAAFLFGAGADDDPALGPVGPHLQQNHYSIIFMQILPEENKQAR